MAAPPPRRRDPGILSEPIDLDGPRRGGAQHPTVAARPGLVLKQRGTPITGTVVGIVNGYLHVRDRRGFEHRMALLKGGFEVDGQVVTLVAPQEGSGLRGEDVIAFLKAKLASYKVPRKVIFVSEDDLNLTGSAKIKPAEARALAARKMTEEAGRIFAKRIMH